MRRHLGGSPSNCWADVGMLESNPPLLLDELAGVYRIPYAFEYLKRRGTKFLWRHSASSEWRGGGNQRRTRLRWAVRRRFPLFWQVYWGIVFMLRWRARPNPLSRLDTYSGREQSTGEGLCSPCAVERRGHFMSIYRFGGLSLDCG